MSKNDGAKILAFFLLIVLPVGLYFFFKPDYGDKRILIPDTYHPRGIDTVLVEGEKTIDTVYHKIPQFKFATHLGDSLSEQDLKGNIFVADFFFTNCPGICPILTTQLTRVQEAFAIDENVKIVSYSVDPDRDSIPALKAFANRYNALPDMWYFLRASKEEVFNLAKEGYYVTAMEGDMGPEDFVHSDKLVLVDENLNIRGYYTGTDSAEVNDLMRDIVLLLAVGTSHNRR